MGIYDINTEHIRENNAHKNLLIIFEFRYV